MKIQRHCPDIGKRENLKKNLKIFRKFGNFGNCAAYKVEEQELTDILGQIVLPQEQLGHSKLFCPNNSRGCISSNVVEKK